MKSKIGTFILIVVIVAVAGVMIWFAHKIIVEQNGEFKPTNNVTNDVNKNISNNTEKKENKVNNNVNNTNEENKTKEEQNNIASENKNTGATNEEKAINIVKQNWGNSDGVYFTTMGIDADGRYIVTVNDSTTTAIFATFAVNIETGEVAEQ